MGFEVSCGARSRRFRPWRALSTALLLSLGGAAAHGVQGCGSRTGLRWDGAEAGVLEPVPCPVYDINRVRLGEVAKVDLLFVIDNSISMTDKQELLKDAIPPLVQRLANPLCVDGAEPPEEIGVDSPAAPCPAGFAREFEPINDIHIGIISSSLGARGGDICSNSVESDDHARLIGTLARGRGLTTYRGLGFLAWDPDQALEPPGEADIDALERQFQDMLGAVGDTGCGFEAPLEALYRFLVDPAPPASVLLGRCGSGACTEKRGTDTELLAQRAAFLRPDSLVAVVLLSDENDCSAIDAGPAWLMSSVVLNGRRFHLPRATSICATDPNDRCCQTCAASSAVPGCPPLDRDPECQFNGGMHDTLGDAGNLRCFDQKRRFGFDLLYPTARYAVALRELEICPNSIYNDADCLCRSSIERAQKLGLPAPPCTRQQTGAPVPNPLYQNLGGDAAFGREPAQVFLAAIVGVPWQDIASEESLSDPATLEYLDAAALARVDPALGMSRWEVILGDPETNTPPADPFMRESVAERSGVNPITRDPIVASSSFDPRANAINGHERPIPEADDLQYACTFPLSSPRQCTPGGGPCDCLRESASSPLCQEPGANRPGGATQFFAKAYPGLRHLDVLKRFGNNGILASICPKVVSGDETDLAFGYRPAVSGLVKRLRCTGLDAEFERNPDSADYGTVPCRLVAVSGGSGGCDCDGSERLPLDATLAAEVARALELRGACGGTSGVDCASFCGCEVPQARESSLAACQNETSESPLDPTTGRPVNGWCYLDPEAGFGNPALIESCPPANFKNIRIVGGANAREGEELFVACPSRCAGPGSGSDAGPAL